MIHRGALEVHPVGGNLFGDLLPQQGATFREPVRCCGAFEAGAHECQGCGVLEKVVACEMKLEAPGQPLRLAEDALPEGVPEWLVLFRCVAMLRKEDAAEVHQPKGYGIGLPAHPPARKGVPLDPVENNRAGILVVESPEPLEIVQVILPEFGRIRAIPLGHPTDFPACR